MARICWQNAYSHGLQDRVRESQILSLDRRLKQEYQQLSFLNLKHVEELTTKLEQVKEISKPYQYMLVLGIGGSALGAKALQKAFYRVQDLPGHQDKTLLILDNIYPEKISATLNNLPPEKTLVVAISKSGTTIETLSQYFLFKKWLQTNVSKTWSRQLIIITDPEQGFLRQEVEQNDLFSLDVPPNLGGRFSVLSSVGLVPAVFMGLDWTKLIAGAKKITQIESLENHPACKLARWAVNLYLQGKNELIFFNYVPLWEWFGQWFAQLWAESLGKEEKGSLPVPAVGVRDQHSLLQMFVDGPKNKGCLLLTASTQGQGPGFDFDLPEKWQFLYQKKIGDIFAAETLGTEMALVEKMPLVKIKVENNLEDAGKLIMLLELATLLAGWLLNINPLNQPGVERGKRLAKAKLGAPGFEQEKKDLDTFLSQRKQEEDF